MMFIHGAAAYTTAPADVKVLKEELKNHIDTYFRRVSKFVLLALIGACSCAARRPLEQDTAVYLTTENGNLADTESVLSQIYRREGKPLVAYVPHVEKYRMLIEGFELNQVPVSPSIEGAVAMAEALWRCR